MKPGKTKIAPLMREIRALDRALVAKGCRARACRCGRRCGPLV
jgi:hypothetical protein